MKAFLLAVAIAVAAETQGARMVIVGADAPGKGFDDPTPVQPMPGNPATTLGAQRLVVFQAAADAWGARLQSVVDIRVQVQFVELQCSPSSAVLGFAGAVKALKDFNGAPRGNTLYPIALANSLARRDVDPASGAHFQVDAKFNALIDTGCFAKRFYYGLDGNPPADGIDLRTIVLHELTHGLGFLTLVNLSTGARALNSNDVFMLNLFDEELGLPWSSMTDSQRVASETRTGKLVWTGRNASAAAVRFVSGIAASGRPLIYAPEPFQAGSVTHWDDALAPDELLEPAYTGPLRGPVLADQALYDIGWVPAPQAAPITAILPSSAHIGGRNGAFFTTDLTLRNSGAADATFTLKFLGHDADGRTGVEKTFALGAGKSVTYADVLASVFEAGDTFGAILITSSAPLAALSQTSTPAPAGGTFGQSVPVFATADLLTSAAPRSIVAVREDAAARTNLILASTAFLATDVDVRLVSESGATLATRRYTLPPLGMTQVGSVVRDLGIAGDVARGTLVLSTPTADGAVAAYAAVIDNVTNDPRTLLPR